MPIRKTLDDAIRLAKRNGGLCLSREYKNAISKLEWQCSGGHRWKTSYANIQQGCWCPVCANPVYDIGDVIRFAQENGIMCLSRKYINNSYKLKWKCGAGHTWKQTFKSIRNSKALCRECFYLEKAQKISEIKQICCLSRSYESGRGKLKWKCKNGHIFYTTLDGVKRYGCQQCYLEKISYTIEDAIKIAKTNGGRCLSSRYNNNSELLSWECSVGHVWRAPLSRLIHFKSWCPVCIRSKGQAKLEKILFDIFNMKPSTNQYPFEWLRDNGRLQIDIWFDNLGLAVEYDGIQHFEPTRFGGMSKEQAMVSFKKQKIRDSIKNSLIKEHPKDIRYFVRFSYKENITKAYVVKKLKKYGIKV